MAETSATAAISEETARRFAIAAGETQGVASLIVCGRDGEVLAGSGPVDVRKEAALASFIVQRAEALAQDGDLRGMGRSLAHGRLEEITLSGPAGDSVLLSFPHCFALVSMRPGVSGPAAVASLRNIARRYF